MKLKTDRDEVKIYTAEMAVILTSKALPVQNLETLEKTQLNGLEYVNTYVQAYRLGNKISIQNTMLRQTLSTELTLNCM